uniref:Uncharacterized protein n=1 Tax=Glossina palpalis gambiensis TaxID=67801 RepID=A0A1B0C603_9MUSC
MLAPPCVRVLRTSTSPCVRVLHTSSPPHTNSSDTNISRYKEEFLELAVIGVGQFGKVYL